MTECKNETVPPKSPSAVVVLFAVFTFKSMFQRTKYKNRLVSLRLSMQKSNTRVFFFYFLTTSIASTNNILFFSLPVEPLYLQPSAPSIQEPNLQVTTTMEAKHSYSSTSLSQAPKQQDSPQQGPSMSHQPPSQSSQTYTGVPSGTGHGASGQSVTVTTENFDPIFHEATFAHQSVIIYFFLSSFFLQE